MRGKITSRENSEIKKAVKLLRSAKFRRQEGLFIAEGLRLCRDALESGVPIHQLFYTEDSLNKHAEALKSLQTSAKESILVSSEIMAALSDTVTPQGIVCVCPMLDKNGGLDKINASGHFLGLEDLQDPSNMGTILRTAEALGIKGVILSGGCCDRYSPKVLRGSMGAVFRLPVYSADNMQKALSLLKSKGIFTLAAVPDHSAEPITRLSFSRPSAMIIGNEGNGLKPETIAACHQRVTIPMRGRAESLNASVAASLCMWEMMRSGGEVAL